MKRIFAVLLSTLLFVEMFPAVSFSAEIVGSGTCGENLTWELDEDGVLTISGEGAISDSAFSGNKTITSVIIGDSVTAISHAAFFDCFNLSSVKISNSVTTIESSAFKNCMSLKSIIIPESVSSIYGYAFQNCNLSYAAILNPECMFYGNNYIFRPVNTIYGYVGSTAESFAANYGILFSDVNELCHLWHFNNEKCEFFCEICGAVQGVSPVLGYEYGNDNFSFHHKEIKTSKISYTSLKYVNKLLKVDFFGYIAGAIFATMEWKGSCYGVAAMNSSFFYNIPVTDYGKSKVSDLSVKNADLYRLNQDTKLRDSINIMFLSQLFVGGKIARRILQSADLQNLVSVAKGLKKGGYPPLVQFQYSEGNHAVSIIGIEPDDFFDDDYWIPVYDCNQPNYPHFFCVAKDYSHVSFVKILPNDNAKYFNAEIQSVLPTPNNNIDYMAPGLRQSVLYDLGEKIEQQFTKDSVPQKSPSRKLNGVISDDNMDDENEYAMFVVPTTGQLSISDSSGKKTNISDARIISSDIENVFDLPIVDADLTRIFIPNTTETFTVESDSEMKVHLSNNGIAYEVCMDKEGKAVISDGRIEVLPVEKDTHVEMFYFSENLLNDSDVVGCSVKGTVSQEIGIRNVSGTVEVQGKELSDQSISVIHNDNQITVEEIKKGQEKEYDTMILSSDNSSLKVHYNSEGDILFGDIDGDGNITAADARLALRRAVELEDYLEDSVQFCACDVDHDGKVTAADARRILRAAVGLEDSNDWYVN